MEDEQSDFTVNSGKKEAPANENEQEEVKNPSTAPV